MTWGTYVDDYFLALYGRKHDMAGAKIFYARLLQFMPIETSVLIPIPLTSIERCLDDLWPITTKTLSVDKKRSFRQAIETLIGSWLWELSDKIQNRIPDPIDYIELRRKTFGIDFILEFIYFGKDWQISPDIYCTHTIQELNKAAGDYIWLTNDILSYQKEIEFDGEMHNLVLVIENFLGCDCIQAVEIANDLMIARAKQFEYIVETELPVLFETFQLDAEAREHLLVCIKELQNYMCSSLHWHTNVDRYRESEYRRSVRPVTGTPSGLGTVAARIQDVIGGIVEPAVSIPAQPEDANSNLPKELKTFGVSHLIPPFINKKEEA